MEGVHVLRLIVMFFLVSLDENVRVLLSGWRQRRAWYQMCLPFCSKFNRIAALFSRLGDAKTEREIWLRINEHNRSNDERRGLAQADFLRNWWEEEKLCELGGNIEGPTPGGNLTIPPEVIFYVCSLARALFLLEVVSRRITWR